MDDGCDSWFLPFQSGGIIGAAAAASECTRGSELQQEQGLPIGSHVEEQLQQIYLLLDMEEEHGGGHAAEAPSSQSSTFHSSASPDESSSLMPGSSNNSWSCHHQHHAHTAEVSTVTYYGDRHHGHCYGGGNLLDGTVPNNLEEFTCQEAHHHERAQQRRHGHGGGAFMPYSRHLGTRKKPNKLGSGGGQRAVKAAISALARMHMVRLAQWQRYQMEMAAVAAATPPPPTDGSNGINQRQHVLSERKRRERLNDSFKALRTVLPPAPKKDKASILMRARDYVNTLKSRVSELEERSRMLAELQHHSNNGGDLDYVSGEKIEVSIDRAAAEEKSQEFHLKIVVRSGCNALDAVVGILERLKEIGDDVRFASMDTASRATTLTLQMKTSRCDDNFLKESVIKSVRGVMHTVKDRDSL